MPSRLIFAVVTLTIGLAASAQQVENVSAQVLGSKFTVHYSLSGHNSGDRFQVKLYCSINDFTQPLKDVVGDIGDNIKEGHDLKIVWDANREKINGPKKNIVFEVRAVVFDPLVEWIDLAAGKRFIRGRKYLLSWSSRKPIERLTLSLVRNEKMVWSQKDIANTGNFDWPIPRSLKPHNQYQLRISDAKDSTDVVYSSLFKIRRRIPLVAKIGGVVAIGIAAGLLSGKKETSSQFPSPPAPPN